MTQYKTIVIYVVFNSQSKRHLKKSWKNTGWSDWESKTSSHFP